MDMQICLAGRWVSPPGSPSSRDPAKVTRGVSDVVAAGLVEDLGCRRRCVFLLVCCIAVGVR